MNNPNASHSYHPYHQLFGCQLKMRRAQEHFHALSNTINEFTGGNPYEIVNDFKPEINYYALRFKVREWPSPTWSPIIGDMVHNMRSALDHLTWQLVLRNSRKPSTGNLFPIFTKDPLDPTAYVTEGEYKTAHKRWKDRIRGMHPHDVDILKLLQPYQRGEDAKSDSLARLNELSNRDKHREFHFAAQSLMEYDFSVKETTRNASPRPVYFKPKGEILKDGEVIARFIPSAVGPDPQLDMDLTLHYDIAFGEGSPLEGLAFKEALPTLFRHTADIILEFKERFDYQLFDPPS